MSNNEKPEEEKEADETGKSEHIVEEGSEEEEDDCHDEGIHLKFLRCPKLPSQKEVDEHNVTHWPYRNWCPICIKARARNVPHNKQTDREHQVPHIHIDYGFFGNDDDEEKVILQVARDEESRALFVHAVPRKGMTHEHGAREICKDITKIGYKKIVIKGDNEPAIHSLQEEIRSKREDDTVIENSPVGQSQSNGVAERAVQAAGEQLRTIKLALENRLNVGLPATHPVVAWMANHGADILNKLAVGPRQDQL
jgi:hypothetical protein